MTTGEGGMLTTNSDDLFQKLKILRSHGMTTLTFERHKGHASDYDVVALGYNYRIDEIRSAIGRVQLQKLPANNEKRREVFRWYREELLKIDRVIVPFCDRPLDQATPHIMSIILKSGYDETRMKLKDAGIQTSKHYQLIPRFRLYADSSRFVSRISNVTNLLTLPLYPGLTRDDVRQIVKPIGTVP